MALNLQDMAASAYNIINMLNTQASNLVGLDALWCRATPEINSEDIILQEYTLTNIGVECPKIIKVLVTDSNYNPGNFTVDLFGINYDAPLEINITINEWKDVFGTSSMPQQGDVVYIKMLHKLYEVKTSEIIYSIASMPTYYKCQMSKYNPTASRRETEEFKNSIDELTVSQETLFGDAISQEVADAAVEVETSYQNTTYTDPLKDYDIESVAYETLTGPDGNVISHAFYDFNIASEPVVYHTPASYTPDSERSHWIFTSWFRANPDSSIQTKEAPVRKFTLYFQDKKSWIFKIGTPLKISVGDEVTILRGNLIKVTGTVVNIPNETVLGIEFKLSDMQRLEKKLTKWYETGTFKIQKSDKFNIIKSDNDSFRIDTDPIMRKIFVKFGKYSKTVSIKSTVDFTKWTYIAVDFTSSSVRIVVNQLDVDGNSTLFINEICDENIKASVKSGEFEFESLMIDSVNTSLNIRNIRLYENEYDMEDTYKMDMLSPVTKSASKLILVDGPMPKNEGMFYSPVR